MSITANTTRTSVPASVLTLDSKGVGTVVLPDGGYLTFKVSDRSELDKNLSNPNVGDEIFVSLGADGRRTIINSWRR